MKKLIIFCTLIITAMISYCIGYCFFSFENPDINLKGRVYVMPEKEEVVLTKEPQYILYPFYGEILIYQSDGSFYDYTGIYLCDLSKDEQINILKRDRLYTLRELYNYLNSLTS